MNTCTWTEDENGFWNTECGNIEEFSWGDVEENNYRYCPFCGGEIFVVKYVEEDDDDYDDWN